MQKNEQKAELYDRYVRNGSKLEREISKLKSDHAGNVPLHIEQQINEKKKEIAFWENEIKKLYV
jgi:hypothetical protein